MQSNQDPASKDNEPKSQPTIGHKQLSEVERERQILRAEGKTEQQINLSIIQMQILGLLPHDDD